MRRVLPWMGLSLALLAYSLGAFGYIHDKFVSKDMFKYLVEDVREIKQDVKRLLRKN